MSDDVLEKAKEKLKAQRALINTILASNNTIGIVIKESTLKQFDDKELQETSKTYLVASMGNGLIEMRADNSLEINLGDTVKVFKGEDGVQSIVDVSKECIYLGEICTVIEFNEDKQNVTVKAGMGSDKSFVYPGKYTKDQLKPGTEVMVYEKLVIIDIHEQEKKDYTFTGSTGVSWDDIGGLEEEKKKMQECIENPIIHKELYKAYNQKLPKGVLLFGPPGNGKTMLGKAAATSLAALNKSERNGFIYVKGPEILSKWVGEAEEKIRGIFNQAREFFKETGTQAIIFIDEAESILAKRGSTRSSDVDKTIVPQFLAEMDGLEESGAIVILTTNRADILDSAVIREGRIDQKIYIGNPDEFTCRAIMSLHLKNVPCKEKNLVDICIEELYKDDYSFFNVNFKDGNFEILKLGNLVSGAAIANLVKSMITSAMKKDIAGKVKKPSGITAEDAKAVIADVFEQYKKMAHTEFLETYKDKLLNDGREVSNIKKIIHGTKAGVTEATETEPITV